MNIIRKGKPPEDKKNGAVLIVDSEIELQAALTSKLKSSGLTVLKARYGAEVMAILEKEIVDLVIIEPNLADIGGFKLGADIREKTHSSILFLTSGPARDLEEAALAVGALTILSQELHLDDLVTQINLSCRQAIDIASSKTVTQRLVKKLNDAQKKEAMIGAFMESWGEPRQSVKATLTRFARSRSISLSELAEIHQSHSELVSEIRASYFKQLEQVCPGMLRDLREFRRGCTVDIRPNDRTKEARTIDSSK